MAAKGSSRKRLGSRYRSGRSPDWLKFKKPNAPVVRREAEEELGADDYTKAARELLIHGAYTM